jgi:hypothetical protein
VFHVSIFPVSVSLACSGKLAYCPAEAGHTVLDGAPKCVVSTHGHYLFVPAFFDVPVFCVNPHLIGDADVFENLHNRVVMSVDDGDVALDHFGFSLSGRPCAFHD